MTGWFTRIERRCAEFIERAFAQVFPSDLEPAQIARKLVATMEARTEAADGGMVAPARYTVRVHLNDFERLRTHRTYLQTEWSALLADVAQRVGIRFEEAQRPEVELIASEDVVPGGVGIDTGSSSPPAQSAFTLRMVKGVPPDGSYRVTGAMRLGRSPQSDIVLADPSVSRNHALLDVRGDALLVRDADSTNGTFVNGERVAQRALRPGDNVTFGKTQMRVESAL